MNDECATRVENRQRVRHGTSDLGRIHTEDARPRTGRIRQWPENVEDRPRPELATNRGRMTHRGVMERREHEPEAERVYGLGDALRRLLEREAERLEDVGGSRNRADRTVPVLR